MLDCYRLNAMSGKRHTVCVHTIENIHIQAHTMEEVRTFLDSSTIHGLAYISSTRKFFRVIWVLVVIGGFTGAGVLIYQSFDSWATDRHLPKLL